MLVVYSVCDDFFVYENRFERRVTLVHFSGRTNLTLETECRGT